MKFLMSGASLAERLEPLTYHLIFVAMGFESRQGLWFHSCVVIHQLSLRNVLGYTQVPARA